MKIPKRLLLGPGPSNAHPRVLAALAQPLIGHLDPAFITLMEELKQKLRLVFRTKNALTFPVSATGSAGMECCLANLLEAGDEAVILTNGVFGKRMADIVERLGATPIVVDVEWGKPVTPEDARAGLARAKRPKLLAAVHAETSTGAMSPVEEIGPIVRQAGALFVVDAVTSLAGAPLEIDAWDIDACYSGTQKCLSCPPGLAPVTFGPRAIEVIQARTTKVASWYLDTTMIAKYWGEERVYHHTAPISMNYALLESLEMVLEEGLEARWKRHDLNHRGLAAGLEALGFSFVVAPAHRLPMLNSVFPPPGVELEPLRRQLLDRYSIEVGAGLGPYQGKIWRIGLMGESSRREHVLTLLEALQTLLAEAGAASTDGAAVAAAERVFGGPTSA